MRKVSIELRSKDKHLSGLRVCINGSYFFQEYPECLSLKRAKDIYHDFIVYSKWILIIRIYNLNLYCISLPAKFRPTALPKAQLHLEFVQKEIATEQREAHAKLKDELHRKRIEFKNELKREQLEIDRLHEKVNTRTKIIEQREIDLNVLKGELQHKEREISRATEQVEALEEKAQLLVDELREKLEKTSNMTQDEACKELFEKSQA